MNNLKIKLLVSGILVAASVFCFSPTKAEATTAAELQTMILQLQNQINDLQRQLNEAQSVKVPKYPSVFFSSVSYSVGEAAGSAVITVQLSATATQTASIYYKTEGGTASPYYDYLPASGTLTFYSGQKIKTFNVSITNDSLVENNETVGLYLSNPVKLVLGTPSTSTLIIIDNDQPPVVPTVYFSSPTYSVNENATSTPIFVRLSTTTSNTVTVAYYTYNGTAMSGYDYIAASGTLTFTPGTIQRQFDIYIIDDSIYEGNETVNLRLYNPVNATLGSPSSSVLTIIDNEQMPINPTVYFSSPTYSVNETSVLVNLTVNLSTGTSNTVNVNYNTLNGTAITGSDYYATSGTLIFSPYQTSKMIPVYVINDFTYEPTEYFYATLSSPVNANLGSPSSARIDIIDDDTVMPTVYFSSPTYSVNENATSAPIFVRLSTTTSNTVTVAYYTYNGTAMAGYDYVAASGTLTFNPGTIQRQFNVYMIDDSIYEGNETVNLTLYDPVNATLGSPSGSVLTIIDNESTSTKNIQTSNKVIEIESLENQLAAISQAIIELMKLVEEIRIK